jgi:hypothetical protein
MRLIRILMVAAIAVAVPVITATAAPAELSGPCTAHGLITVNGVPQLPVITPRTMDFAKIPQKGVVHWSGTAGRGNRIISGHVDISLPPPIGDVTVGSWGGKSGKHANSGTYKYDFPNALLGLKVPVSGEHTEPGITCTGSMTVQLSGSPLKNPVLIASLILTLFAVINFGLVLRARPR